MNKLLFLSIIMVACLSLASCKKNNPDEQTTPVEPIKTAKGVANGPAASKQIGSSGGELVSTDGKLKMTVPAGAVSATTEFSIQPITNTLFEDESRIAYRLLPEGTTFAKPVQLQFAYTPADTIHTTEDALTIAYQRNDGAWAVLPTALDKAAKKLTVETTHFSDWTKTGGLYLEADEKILGLGQKTKIRVISVSRVNATATDGDEVLAPLIPLLLPEDRNKLESINNWRIASGIGGISVESGQLGNIQHEAEYGAPSSMTPTRKDITITVDVKGYNLIKDPSATGGVRKLNKMILFEHLVVVKEYMKGTFDGQTLEFVGQQVGCELNPVGLMVFVGINNSLFSITLSAQGSGPGEYTFNHVANSASVAFWNGNPGYGGSWLECSQLGTAHFSPEPLKVTKWGAAGTYAEGSYDGPVYLQDGNCGKTEKWLSVEFSIVRDR